MIISIKDWELTGNNEKDIAFLIERLNDIINEINKINLKLQTIKNDTKQ